MNAQVVLTDTAGQTRTVLSGSRGNFRFADVEARKQGRHVAQWAFAHFLRPIDDDQGEDDDSQ